MSNNWPFTPQPNKWGYLNNPNWVPVPVAPVNYDGNESNEPQIWVPGSKGSVGNSVKHFPCGHWHKIVIVPIILPM